MEAQLARTAAARQRMADSAHRQRARSTAKRHLPDPPAGLSDAGLARWSSTWRQCPWLEAAHEPVVQRLAELEDERTALRAALDESGLVVKGSRAQPVLNPLFDAVRTLEVAMTRCEKQLGISVLASRAATISDDDLAQKAGERPTLRQLKEGSP
jgi:hypothetical protein